MNKTLLIFLFALVFLAIDFYAYQLYKVAIQGFSPPVQRVLKWVYLSLGFLSLLAFFFYHFGNPDALGKHARTFIMSGIFLNYLAKTLLMVFALLDDAQRGIRWLVQKLSNPNIQSNSEGISRSEFLAKTGVVVALAPVVSLSWGILSGAHDYRVRRINVPIKGLPKGLHGLRVAQLSDIHSGSFWNKIAVQGGMDLLQAEKADIAFFTGDLVNNRASEMKEWGSTFSKLKAPLGTFSVLGNHDYGDYATWPSEAAKAQNLKTLGSIHKNMGWELLLNEHRILEIEGEKLGIIGVENWSAKGRFPKYGRLNEAIAQMPKTSANILLSHDPSHWQAEVLPQFEQINLTLSGHTHGMQFGIEIPGFKWSPVQYVYDEWAGLYQANSQYLYVNRGFGYIGYPGRFGILPEISILTLEAV